MTLPSDPALALEDLLQHESWLRPLLRSLVQDDADDLLQETWVRALQKAPGRGPGLRPWLARVARNLAVDRRRQELRRVRREREVARSEAMPSAAETAERLQVHSAVAQAVSQLPEPYRTAVMLRHVHGLESAAIAERLGIRGNALRQRVHRGLQMLRVSLGERLGPDWRQSPAVAALVSAARPTGLGVSLTLVLGALMSKPLVYTGAASLLLGLVALIASGALSGSPGQPESLPPSLGSAQPARVVAGGQDSRADGAAQRVRLAAVDEPPDLPAVDADGRLQVHIEVRDTVRDEPVPGAQVAILERMFNWFGMSPAERNRVHLIGSDRVRLYREFGRVVEADERGRITLPIASDLFLASEARALYGELQLASGGLRRDQLHVLELTEELRVQVAIEDAAGRPAPFVQLALLPFWSSPALAEVQRMSQATNSYGSYATDADGMALVRNLRHFVGLYTEQGREPDGLILCALLGGGERHEITRLSMDALPEEVLHWTLPPTSSVRVLGRDEEGRPAGDGESARLEPLDGEDRTPWVGEPVAEGETLFRYVPAGREFQARLTGWSISGYGESETVVFDSPPAGESLDVVVPVHPAPVRVFGRIVDEQGVPQRMRFRIRHEIDSAWQNIPVTSDGHGRFVIDLSDEWLGLRPRQARVVELVGAGTGPGRALLDFPEPLRAGNNELGDVVVRSAPVLAAGSVRIEGAVPIQRPTVVVDRYDDTDEDWVRESDLFADWPRAGEFVLRADAPPGRYRLRIDARDALPMAPAEFAFGDEALSYDLRAGGALEVQLQGVAERATIEYRLRDLEEREQVADASGSWRGLPAGPYRLEVFAAGHDRPLRELDVSLTAGSTAVVNVDLGGALQRFVVVPGARDQDRLGLMPAALWQGERPLRKPVAFQLGGAEIWAKPGSVWTVMAQGHAVQTVELRSEETYVDLLPLPVLRVHLPRVPDQDGASLQLQVRRPDFRADPRARYQVSEQVLLAPGPDGLVEVPIRSGETLRIQPVLAGAGRVYAFRDRARRVEAQPGTELRFALDAQELETARTWLRQHGSR